MRHRITFDIEAREVEDFARLGVCTAPREFKIEPVKADTEAVKALKGHGFFHDNAQTPDHLRPRAWK